MPRLGRAATLACALAATGYSAAAQEGDVAAGHAFAREACKTCHVVGPEKRRREPSTSPRLFAPSRTPPG